MKTKHEKLLEEVKEFLEDCSYEDAPSEAN